MEFKVLQTQFYHSKLLKLKKKNNKTATINSPPSKFLIRWDLPELLHSLQLYFFKEKSHAISYLNSIKENFSLQTIILPTLEASLNYIDSGLHKSKIVSYKVQKHLLLLLLSKQNSVQKIHILFSHSNASKLAGNSMLWLLLTIF